MKILLSKFDLSHVKRSNPGDFKVLVHYGRSFTLSLGQNDVNEVLGWRYNRDTFEVVRCHDQVDGRTRREKTKKWPENLQKVDSHEAHQHCAVGSQATCFILDGTSFKGPSNQ